MEIVITLERNPGAPTVAVYSDEPNITVVRAASVTDKDLLVAYAQVLEEHNRDLGDGEDRLSIDGDQDLAMPRGRWAQLRERYGLEDEALDSQKAQPTIDRAEGT